MIIKNYPQFSKKALFIGVDKAYFLTYVIIQTPIFFIFLFTFTALIPIIFIACGYVASVIVFAKNNHIMERKIAYLMLKNNLNLSPR